MSNRPRASLSLLFACGATTFATAQDPPARVEIARQREAAFAGPRASLLQSLREDLASDDPVRIAWAAHDVGRWRIQELESAVVTALMRAPKRDLGALPSARPGTAYSDCNPKTQSVEGHATLDPHLLHRYVAAVLLDALVDLDATVPQEFMQQLLLESTTRNADAPSPFSFFRGARGPALVLFAKHTADYSRIVDRVVALTAKGELTPTNTLTWIAASWCVPHDPKKLAEQWLALPNWRVTIKVRGGHGLVPVGNCGGMHLPWSIAWPDRFPPPVFDLFTATPTAGSVCLVEKPVPLFWRRESSLVMEWFVEQYAGEPDEVDFSLRDTFVVTMLRAAGEVIPARPAIPVQQEFTIDWHDNDSLLLFARAKRAEIESCWKEVVAALIYHYRVEGPLPDRYPPAIKIDFIDERGAALRKSDPLPDPP
jgi:hypothetical protein